MQRIISAFLVSFCIGAAVAPPLIFLLRKCKAKQSILSYVEQHKSKEGIPTMGGIIFLTGSTAAFLIFSEGKKELATVSLAVTMAYGAVGALDDGIKIFFRRNLGLKPYQKIISQSAIALLATYFAYRNEYIGTVIDFPWGGSADIGYWYFPFSFVVYIATTNAVNLTDGLDGLAGSCVALFLGSVFAIIFGLYWEKSEAGLTFYAEELYNLSLYCATIVGGIVAFLLFNGYRAKVFMGDTGSLALGGCCAVVCLFIKNPIIIATVGIMFVITVISVIVQVVVFKLKKKRVFLMAPLHHHFEMKGVAESKIVTVYSVITALFGLICVMMTTL